MKINQYKYCGFRRIAAAVTEIRIADPDFNTDAIIAAATQNKDCDLIVFPELCISGYTCADLFNQSILLDKCRRALLRIRDYTLNENSDTCLVVGAPLEIGTKIYNCAVFIYNGNILGAIPKCHIPNYGEYYELRWFASGYDLDLATAKLPDFTEFSVDRRLIFDIAGMKVSAEICEDLWAVVPPSCHAALNGADIIVNLSASNETIGKHRYRTQLIAQQSARCRCVYAYASAGAGESSTDVVFPGYAAICSDGIMQAESDIDALGALTVKSDIDIEKIRNDRRRCNTFFSTGHTADDRFTISASSTYEPADLDANEDDDIPLLGMKIDPHPFVPADSTHKDSNCTEIIRIQCLGLMQRLKAINCKDIVIGVSGGLDSTLALLVACRTFDMMGISRKGIHAITMPGLATTSKTRNNAWNLMELLGTECIEIPIGAAVAQHFSDIGQDPERHDATFENSQARERTQILMDYANKTGGIVLGTGDLSELALGWCTYNGDQMSMYGVNASVPKTLVKHLVEWFANRDANPEIRRILIDIIETPISPELVPGKEGEIAQKTEDLVGPYELHDFFLFNTLRNGFSPLKIFFMAKTAFAAHYDDATIMKWERTFYRRFFNQQFKRSCMPDGPKVGSVCLSPRGDWRMPSDASSHIWLAELDDYACKHSLERVP